MTQNINVTSLQAARPFLPQAPLPLGVAVGAAAGMMYMYSCVQCDFKTHIEAMFKQHVDSVHLGGITSSQVVSTAGGQSIILSPNNVISTTQATAGGQTLAVNPLTITPGGAVTQVVASQGQTLHTAGGQQMTLVTGVKSAAPGVVTLSPTQGGQVTAAVTQPTLATSGVLTSMAAAAGTSAQAGQTVSVPVNNVTTAVTTVVHKCPKCGFLAPSKNQLTQHRKKFHGKQALNPGGYAQAAPSAPVSAAAAAAASGKKTFNCSTCGYTTTRRDGLSQHYDSVHLKIKNHQCTLCPYAASQKGTLNRHVKLRHKKKDDLLLGQ